MADKKLTALDPFPNTLVSADLVHIVDISDITQDPDGSSYKLQLGSLFAFINANLPNRWLTAGNAGTEFSTNYLGTSDAVKLALKTNNILALTIDLSQNVGIGTATPNNKIQVLGLIQFHPTNFSTHLGSGAGSGNTGNYCSFVGFGAGGSANTGERNTYVGYAAGGASTSGIWNVAIGVGAFQFATTANRSTAIGTSCLQFTTTGFDNSAIGANCMNSNTTGSQNDAFGVDCMFYNTTGNYSAVFGGGGAHSNRTGGSLAGCGVDVLRYNVSGDKNTALGCGASPVIVVPYDNLVGTFQINEKVTDIVTGAYEYVRKITPTHLYLGGGHSPNTWAFNNNDGLLGQTSGATALVNGTIFNPDSTVSIGFDALTYEDGEINIGNVYQGVQHPTDSTLNTAKLVGNTTITEGLSFSRKEINTASGNSATINAPRGRFRKGTTGSTFVLTNSFITANSIIHLTAANAAIDGTATAWTVSAGVGTATITFNAAPSADFDMNFSVDN